MRWVTYFPEINRFHLTKDVGLIPHYASKEGFTSSLVGKVKSPFETPAEVSGLELEILPEKGKLFFLDRAFLNWLRENASTVKVLHLFHLTRDSIFYGAYFKRLNPQGKLYLKFDAYNDHLTQRKRYANGEIKNFILQKVERRFFHGLDLATIENRNGLDLAKKNYPEISNLLQYLPNGCNDAFLDERFGELISKEKRLLTVGRLGSSDKNFELLLKSIPLIELSDWHVDVVGPITQDFQLLIDRFTKEYLHLENRITFHGSITDRSLLYKMYARSAVFFLPSRFESFGISFVEALYFGCVLVGHKGLYAYDDISDNGSYGIYYEDNDSDSFARALEKAMKVSQDYDLAKARLFAKRNFAWSALFEKIKTFLSNE